MSTRREILKLAAAALSAAPVASALPKSSEPEKSLNILILGGTGFTGPHQVRYALARGHKVTLFNRGRRPQDWSGAVTELVGDREKNDLEALKGQRFDVCIDNPTSIPHWVRDVGKVLKANVKHYVFISTISVYSSDQARDADETAATHIYKGKDKYAETRETLLKDMALYGPLKAECEREAAKWFAGKLTVIRPGLIVGPGDETDRFSYWPVRIARGGTVLAPPADDPVQFIDARDLAEWTIRMAEARAFGTFNATGPDYSLSAEAMLFGMRACTAQGADLKFTTGTFLEKNPVQPWSEFPVWVPGQGEMAGFARRSFAKAKAQGLRFRTLADTTQATLSYFESLPKERQATLRAGLKPERESELLALLTKAD